jgi:fermentation-respiration switch protein FrsA (DUF1100 family)
MTVALHQTLAMAGPLWQHGPEMNMRRIRWMLFLGAILASLLILVAHSFEYSRVYKPGPILDASVADVGLPFQDVYFKTRDGVELNGWFFPADTNSPRAQIVFLVCHGNEGSIGRRQAYYQILLKTGVSVFAFDYRGYGHSGGRPSEEGTYLDAQAAYGWLRQKGYVGHTIIPLGESLGGGVASELCLREETGGIILESTFTNIRDLGEELFPWLPVRWINTIQYDTHGKLPRVKVPVLILHSHEDKWIAFHHAEKNFAAAKEPKLLWEIKGVHGDPLADPALFQEGIERFLRLTNGGRVKTSVAKGSAG